MPHRNAEIAGQAPGTAVYTGERPEEAVQVKVFDYTPTRVQELTLNLDTLAQFKSEGSVTWINLTGLADVTAVQRLCEAFEVHPLAVEDIVAVDTRPKAEEYPDQLFLVAKMLEPFQDPQGHTSLRLEHVCVVIGPGYVLTFQERPGDVFDGIRRRLKRASRLRERGADYLGYALLDAVVDQIIQVLGELSERAELLEDELLGDPREDHLQRVYHLRRQLMTTRRAVLPLRDAVSLLIRSEGIHESTVPFLRDLQDHVLQAIDTTDSYRDLLLSMVDLYMTGVSHRMNEVMQVLTILATIFVPLTFVSSIYGMNFDEMPELHWRYGYPAVWLLMISMSGVMGLWFRRKGWL